MTYIRLKKINHQDYAYLVENLQTEKGPRQKVRKYLGKVHHLKASETIDVDIEAKNKNEMLHLLTINQLVSCCFKEKEQLYELDDLLFSPKDFTIKTKNQKEAVLKINDGHLCSFTLQRILKFKKSADLNKDAFLLAKYFLEAGLPISKTNFIRFYELV